MVAPGKSFNACDLNDKCLANLRDCALSNLSDANKVSAYDAARAQFDVPLRMSFKGMRWVQKPTVPRVWASVVRLGVR